MPTRLILTTTTAILLVVAFFLGRQSTSWLPLDPPEHSHLTVEPPPLESNEFTVELPAEIVPFRDLFSSDVQVIGDALKKIYGTWTDSYVIMLLEVLRFSSNMEIHRQVIRLIETSVDAQLGQFDPKKWSLWVWNTDPGIHPHYAKFKAAIYSQVDESFGDYFDESPPATIRLDEIVWGGVERDGIPPLDHPMMISADEASYLGDDNVVFGVEIHGDARAYPKRILAHHEMVKDKVGDEEINGVYCTLCGSMIVYQATVEGVHYELGTSGFLYRSNKLMYDHATRSLWNTLTGKPVVGPLVGKGIELQSLYTVTTTWGEWRQRHPTTQVLSLETGHIRDYAEGAAYKNYFATDELMFPVPKSDDRLRNKAEVLVLRFADADEAPLAISSEFLAANSIYYDELGGISFVVLTDPSGASRVYETQGKKFASWDQQDQVVDQEGNSWQLAEEGLLHERGDRLNRLPAHRAFWFGWYAVHPDTRLVK